MTQKWAVLRFPGSNSDADALKAIQQYPKVEAVYHWHEDPIQLGQYQVLIIPGGFSFGDYLRAGAIAKLSKSMENLEQVIEAGCHVMGICNGFQILLEARLLPGVLQANKSLRFISRTEACVVSASAYPWFDEDDLKKTLNLPIAHGYGNFQMPDLDSSEARPVLRYLDNPNGSKESIAGIYRQLGSGSVFGLMPHPERASYLELKQADGALFWRQAVEALA